LEGGQQPHTHVHRPVSQREHPAVAGHRRPAVVTQVQLALEEPVGRPRRAVVAASSETHRIVLAPRHAESPTEAVEGPVGDDDHRRRHPLGFAPADQVDSDEEAVFHDRFRFGLLPHPDPLLLGEGGDLLVQVAAPDHPTPVGKARMLGPLQLEHDRVAGVRAEPVYAVEAGDVEVESHLAELEDRPRREPVATGLVAGVFLPLDEGHVVAGASQPIGGRRSRRSAADYEEGRRGHCHGGYRSPGGGGESPGRSREGYRSGLERETLAWAQYGVAVRELAAQVADSGYRPDIILAIARGGLFVAGSLGYALSVKNLYVMNLEFYTGVGERLDVPMVLPPYLDPAELADTRILVA